MTIKFDFSNINNSCEECAGQNEGSVSECMCRFTLARNQGNPYAVVSGPWMDGSERVKAWLFVSNDKQLEGDEGDRYNEFQMVIGFDRQEGIEVLAGISGCIGDTGGNALNVSDYDGIAEVDMIFAHLHNNYAEDEQSSLVVYSLALHHDHRNAKMANWCFKVLINTAMLVAYENHDNERVMAINEGFTVELNDIENPYTGPLQTGFCIFDFANPIVPVFKETTPNVAIAYGYVVGLFNESFDLDDFCPIEGLVMIGSNPCD